jgi:hypothetical protein
MATGSAMATDSPDAALSDRIAAFVKKKSQRRPYGHARNRVVFLALREDIESALKNGWARKHIWETLHAEGKIGFGYDAFLAYVDQLVGKQPKRRSRARTPQSSPR